LHNFFKKQLSIFFAPADSFYYLVHKNIKVQLHRNKY